MTQPPSDSPPTFGDLGYEVVDHLRHPIAMQVRDILSPRDSHPTQDFIIDDEENIEQALNAGLPLRYLLYSGEQALPDALAQRVKAQEIPIYEVARRTCKKLFDKERASRLFAVAPTPAPQSLQTLANGTRDLVVLDHLTIQGNIGAIIRNAVAFEIGAVVLLGADTKAIYDRRLVRASRGYVFALPIVGASTEDFLAFAKQSKIQVAATDAHAPTRVEDIGPEQLPARIAMVLGSEKQGCSERLKTQADLNITIPMNLDVESLNVSAACAIMMHRRYAHNAGRPA